MFSETTVKFKREKQLLEEAPICIIYALSIYRLFQFISHRLKSTLVKSKEPRDIAKPSPPSHITHTQPRSSVGNPKGEMSS